MKKSSQSKGVVIRLSEILNGFDGELLVKTNRTKKEKRAKKKKNRSLQEEQAKLDRLLAFMKDPIVAGQNASETPSHINVDDLEYVTEEEVKKFPDLLRSDWEYFNWSRKMFRKFRPDELTERSSECGKQEPNGNEEEFSALTDRDRVLSHWAFHVPLPDGSMGAGASLLSDQPQYYIITGADESGDEPIPLSRGCNAPLTWSRQSNDDIGVHYPIPQIFDLATAEDLVKQQLEYDEKHDAGECAMKMHIIPVCTDPNHIAKDGDIETEEDEESIIISNPPIGTTKKTTFSLPTLPDSSIIGFQYYMITGVRKGQEDDLVAGPMTRHTECPLYFADTYGHPDEQLPSPLLFSLETAKQLIKDQKDWEESNNVDPDQRFVMFFFPVFPDNGNVQIAPKQSQKLTASVV